MTQQAQQLKRQADALYDAYGKPLEDKHYGKYVAIANDGKTVLAPSLGEVLAQARTVLGRGNFVFRVGKKAVYSWR